MTFVLIAINWLIYYLMLLDAEKRNCEGNGFFTDRIMYDWGATTGYTVKAKFEIWRLLVAGYVHADLDHILGNMISFLIFGTLVEWQVGPWHVLNMYNFINVLGNISSLIVWPDSVGIGASTALFGFIGAIPGAVLK